MAAEEKRGELLGIALRWLREDREVRKKRDKERGRERGAKSGGDVSRQKCFANLFLSDDELTLGLSFFPCDA